ncbi:hypothetical protein NKG95_24085 [Mesorhizobium sp. M1423]|uniref:hypothetical protein n=1 Tax=Mesorhizobium sp. M1423 TaxID=2957101 RepID=UPI00333D9A81
MTLPELIAQVGIHVMTPEFRDRLVQLRIEMRRCADEKSGMSSSDMADILQLDVPFVDLLMAFAMQLNASEAVLSGSFVADIERTRH